MNIFLTGETQVGKSTLIRRVLARHPDWKIGGFLTVTRPDDPDVEGDEWCGVYLQEPEYDVGSCPWSADNRVGIRGDHRMKCGFPDVFDTLGVERLTGSRTCDLILMDELGFMEQDASVFQQTVMETLRSSRPVLGVIKPQPMPFLDAVRSAPGTMSMTVTRKNRETLLNILDTFVMDAVRAGSGK